MYMGIKPKIRQQQPAGKYCSETGSTSTKPPDPCLFLHLKEPIFLGQITVTFAHLCCLYLDAQSMLVQSLLGLADLQKSSLDSIPGLAGNSDEGLEAKEGEQLGEIICRMGQAVQHQSVQRHRSLLSPCLLA